MKTTTTASECKEVVCRTYLIGLGVLLPICFLQIYWTRLEFELLLDHLMNDDAFLYLQVVRNIADNGKVTFDGLHITTGIQPLWTIILVPLAVAIADRVEFVRWVLLLSVVLNVAAGLLLARVSVALSGAQFSAGLTALCGLDTCSRAVPRCKGWSRAWSRSPLCASSHSSCSSHHPQTRPGTGVSRSLH